ncbi:GNAT family N-acetyltransferase [Tatumella sp. UBA2305]|uniref:GNAT family N-acetyltransferase n=1 Tax=Tatumella sp. UBA2305 TaxID=1947647 RepID=UPI0025D6E79A|nr:GNAT family N-acetyltransferase [Tatumella sp. UBA2305]
MQLRRFREGDEVALFRVFCSSIRDIAARDYTPQQIAAWVSEDIDAHHWVALMRQLQPFVVEIAGDIAGYADVQPDGYIDHFFVSGKYPRQGVGRLLMNAIHKEAARLKLSELTALVSKTAEPFFRQQGFVVVERGFPVRRGVTLENARMRKLLHLRGDSCSGLPA